MASLRIRFLFLMARLVGVPIAVDQAFFVKGMRVNRS
jgi:hypothetical protein